MLFKQAIARTANWALVKGCVGDFGNFSTFSLKTHFLPCLPHRSRLFRLNSPDNMKFSS